MSKLRKVQFFRNSSVVTTATSHSNAVTLAEAAFNTQLTNMADGELLLYRYQINATGDVHTIVGVVRIDGTNKYAEILANYDMLTSQFDSLDVTGYKQAYVTVNTNDSSFTVQGIQENNGLIGVDGTQGVTINIDGAYDGSTNKIATQSTVSTAITNAVEDLDSIADADTASGTGYATITTTTPTADFKVLNSVTETDGVLTAGEAYQLKKVAATGAAADVTIADSGNLFTATDVEAALAEVQGNVQTVAASIKDGKIKHNSTDVFSANTDSNLTLKLCDFTYDSTDHVLGVNVQTPTGANNKIATMLDIADLSGAMHYKGAIADDSAWPTTVAAGDVYISTGDFDHGSTPIEPGDMIVFNSASNTDYNVINTNIDKGMGTGQVAANQTALTATQIVVAGTTGVQTTGYTFDAEATADTTTIDSNSSNATVPTSKNVYDAIQGLAVNSVSETVGVGTVTNGASITDTLTVDGSASAQTVNVVATQGVSVTPDTSTQTITLAAKVATYAHEGDTTTVSTAQASNLLKTDANGDLSVSDTWDCGTY